MKTFDIYGFETDNLASVVSAVEQVIGAKFEEREGYYRGGTYFKCGNDPRKENFGIQKNYNPMEGEWEEEAFQEKKILLFVNNTERANKLRLKLMTEIPGIALIRRKEPREKPASDRIRKSDEILSVYSESAA